MKKIILLTLIIALILVSGCGETEKDKVTPVNNNPDKNQISNNPNQNNCGNNFFDTGENCSNCPQDVKCNEGSYCDGGICRHYDSEEEWKVPVLSIRYMPSNGNAIDKGITGGLREEYSTVIGLRERINFIEEWSIKALEEASRFRGYKQNSEAVLDYEIIEEIEFLEEIPAGLQLKEGIYRPDYKKILNELNICDYVDNQGVREVWFWGYHFGNIEPVESNLSMGTLSREQWNYGNYGDVSNSERTDDIPICKHTYTLYNYNFGRGIGEALEDHTHQIEALLQFIEPEIYDKFEGECGERQIYRCGWTHYPPNVKEFCSGHDYDWFNTRRVMSDCEDWKPEGFGEAIETNCETWKDVFIVPENERHFVEGNPCPHDGGVGFKVWWMQNIPGKDNGLVYNSKELRNFWEFIGDFDGAIQKGKTMLN